MLLDSEYTIIPNLRFTLTFTNDIRKTVTVKTNDVVNVFYKKDGTKVNLIGKVVKIGCNFNSSLGSVGTTAYMQIDGSAEYAGQVDFIQPSQVIDLSIVSTTDVVDNVVCSVDNEDQRVTLIRENEAGVFQYSLNGQDWKAATGAQGMSAYECAVKLGFDGTEDEWLLSLKGAEGPVGPAGATRIEKIFTTIDEAEKGAIYISKGYIVALLATPSTLLYVRNAEIASTSGGNSGIMCIDGENIPKITGYDYVGKLTLNGEDGKSAYQVAVDEGFKGTETDWLASLVGPKGDTGASNYDLAVESGYEGSLEDWLKTLKGDPGKTAYEAAVEGGYTGTEEDFNKFLAGKVVYDDAINAQSENAVQNKVIAAEIQKLKDAIAAGGGSTPGGEGGVIVADTYYGNKADLTSCVEGPIRLVVYGETKEGTLESKAINTITIYDNFEHEQTLQFPEPIVLRSVPNKVGSCPNVIIGDVPHVADFICEKDGVIGVTRRIKYVENYAGECVLGDFLSSTGDLDLGAQVQYVVYGTFEPLPEDVQEQWKTFHTYEGETHIRTMEEAYISVTYPIDITTYLDEAIKNNVGSNYESYIDAQIQEQLKNKLGDEITGDVTVQQYVENTVVEKVGDIGDSTTVKDYVDTAVENVETNIGNTLGDLGEYSTVVEYVDAKVTEKVNEILQNLGIKDIGNLKEYIDNADKVLDNKIGEIPEPSTNLVEYVNEMVGAEEFGAVGQAARNSVDFTSKARVVSRTTTTF